MKKIFMFLVVLLVSLSLSGCSSPFLSRIYDNSNQIMDKKFEKIIVAFENKDSDAIKGMLSPKALKEAEDLDVGIAIAMEFYKGKMIKYERAFIGYSDLGKEGRTKEKMGYYTVTTDQDVYSIYLDDRVENTIDSEAVGMHSIIIAKEADREKHEFDWGNRNKRPGIYCLE